jgi:hypothetical protein
MVKYLVQRLTFASREPVIDAEIYICKNCGATEHGIVEETQSAEIHKLKFKSQACKSNTRTTNPYSPMVLATEYKLKGDLA